MVFLKEKVQIITQGCSANQADSETMAGLLAQAGYELSDEANLVIINSCTVKGPTETSFTRLLEDCKAKKKKVIVTGCIPQSERSKEILAGVSVLGPNNLHDISTAVRLTMQGETVRSLDNTPSERNHYPHLRRHPLIEILPVAQGCLSNCTFCKTKHARGKLFSFEQEQIIRRISRAVDEGVRAIWLTSQDTSAYGKDLGTSLIDLIKGILSIPKPFHLRIGMGNPEHFFDYLPQFIALLSHPKVYQFVHIPVQSGANAVLSRMKRDYTREMAIELLTTLRKHLPDLFIATDIICGFPGETDEDFAETLSLVEEIQFDAVHISRYWPRPGTPAAKMKQVPGTIQKQRTRALTTCFQEISRRNYAQRVGWQGEVVFFDKGKNGETIGRTSCFRQVILPEQDSATITLGEPYRAHAIDHGTFDLVVQLSSKRELSNRQNLEGRLTPASEKR